MQLRDTGTNFVEWSGWYRGHGAWHESCICATLSRGPVSGDHPTCCLRGPVHSLSHWYDCLVGFQIGVVSAMILLLQ